ncbi:MAG TPA: HAD-IB family hydrolase [Prevotella sp.]|nr:HAD-IB family hydrolase [Prevotella sp.]
MKEKEIIHVFDFDGTLTYCDTLLLFIRYVNGPWRLWLSLLLFLPKLVLMKLHLRDNGRTKEELFAWHFRGEKDSDFAEDCESFAEEYPNVLREAGMATLRKALNQGERVFVVSASIDNWVELFFRGAAQVLGTQLEVKDSKLTGRFTTPNCYGPEKVKRLKAALPDLERNRDKYYIIAYGDSRGDKEMLEFADERHYKPFRR